MNETELNSSTVNVLHISPECAPLAKRGGLGDVVGSLPKALNSIDVDARVLIPAWPGVMEHARKFGNLSEKPEGHISVALNWKSYEAEIYRCVIDNVIIYLLEQKELFNNPDIYENKEQTDATPFIFLSYSTFELPSVIGWKPHILHAHDWTTAAIPAALKWHRYYKTFSNGYDTVFTIHNIAHQGIFSPTQLNGWGFLPQSFSISDMNTMEFYGHINLMKAGIISSEALTTVSPRYSWDIQKAEYGFGLDGVVTSHRDKLRGIINGIDYDIWNPATDPYIKANYSLDNIKGKEICRKALIDKCRFEDDDTPIVIFIGRLAEQKGPGIMLEALEKFIENKVRTVIIGSGNEYIESAVQSFEKRHPGRVHATLKFSEEAARQAYAGGDIMLMPSVFEPCGLSQLIAFKYGTIPVVRATGGLADTVLDADSCKDGQGFVFSEFNADELCHAIHRALNALKDNKEKERIVRNAMTTDFSWKTSAQTYKELYISILKSNYGTNIS